MQYSINPIVSDLFGYLFEMVIAPMQASDTRLEPHRPTDTYYTAQFVRRLQVEEQQWKNFVGDLLKDSEKGRHISHCVAKLMRRNQIRFYKLPRIDKATPIPIEQGKALVFLPSIVNTHRPMRAEKIVINDLATAKRLVVSMSAGQLSNAFKDINNSGQAFIPIAPNEVNLARSELAELLTTGEAWAWKIDHRPHVPSKKAKVEVVPALDMPGNRKVPLGPEAPPKPILLSQSEQLEQSIAEKQVNPQSFDEAKQQLQKSRTHIEKHGKPAEKYTQEELQHIASKGDINEKYIVRVIETQHMKGGEGYLGQNAGGVVKYWSTTFDQLEANDTDPSLICAAVGIDYNPDSDYTLAIIDRAKIMDKEGSYALIPTYENLGNFAKQELSEKMPHPELLKETLSKETSQKYLDSVTAMECVEKGGSWKPRVQKEYFSDNELSEHDQKIYKNRQSLHKSTGANEYFLGNGLTKNMNNQDGSKPYGLVETFSYDKNPQTFNEMQSGKNPSVTTVPLTPIKGSYA